jgi:hypothetical protein
MAWTVNHWLGSINKIGKSSWLVVTVARSNVIPKRNEHGEPMCETLEGVANRIVFQVDGFTTVDFELIGTTLKVQCNRTLLPKSVRSGYYEDKAFADFANGGEYTFAQLRKAVRQFCILSNQRLKGTMKLDPLVNR